MIDLLIRTLIKNHENTADRAVRTAYGNLACVVSVICNLLLFAGKTAAGTLAGSVSITADGLNNLSDASSNLVSLVGFKLGARPADSQHPYGHARYEYLAGLAVSVMILVIGVELLKESFEKVLHPTPVQFGWLPAAVLLASILVKLWMSLLNRRIGRAIQSETLIATAADARNDVVATGAVLAASVLTCLTGIDRIDGVMGLGVAAFILYSGIQLVRMEDKVQLCTRPAFALAVRRATESRRPPALSAAALEVLTVVAYRQPVTRAYIEQLRGVDSSATVAGLLEKGLIEPCGHLDVPGRPILLRTTDAFLRAFGVSSLSELPSLPELAEGEQLMLEETE